MHGLNPLHFSNFESKFIKMHGLTPLHFSNFESKFTKLPALINFTAPQKLGEIASPQAAAIFNKQENPFQRNNIAQVMQPWQQQQQQKSNIPAFNPYFGKK